MSIPAITGTADIVMRLLGATVIGGAIGINRELRRKPAGLRTHAIVAMGAAVVTIVAIGMAPAGTDPSPDALSRVIQGLIAGIGFLGAGAIMKTNGTPEAVHGLTTAATIWLVAAFGIACGLGQWRIATMALVISLGVLIVGDPIERVVKRWSNRSDGQHP